MSKQNFEKALRKELAVLNDKIDEKIIRGLSYSVEARRHKFILSQLASLKKASRSGSGWFMRSLSTMSTFIF